MWQIQDIKRKMADGLKEKESSIGERERKRRGRRGDN